ncbi:MAG: extracellular solute-binding protein [Oscillospiraceae bacterium]|nr:extracellular solute-binding protein [Oscillospiraceae bacterium]
MKRLIAIILVAALLVTILTGCRKNEYDNEIDSPSPSEDITEMIEIIQFPELSETIPNINNLVLSGDKIYFTSFSADENNPHFLKSSIYTINTDGTYLTLLPNYKETHEVPDSAQSGTMTIQHLCVDGAGNIWVSEAAHFYSFDLPEGVELNSVAENDLFLYTQFLGMQTSVRKLDSNAAEILAIDTSKLEDETGSYGAYLINVDSEDNLYMALNSDIHIFNSVGSSLFNIFTSGSIGHLNQMKDGSVAAAVFYGSEGSLRTIDAGNRTWGTEIPLPERAYLLFPGNEEFIMCYADGMNLYGITDTQGNMELILSFTDYGFIPNNITSLILLPDEQVMLTNQSWDNSNNIIIDLHVFKIIPQNVLAEKTVLNLITIGYDDVLRELVMNYNNESTTHRVEVKDYFGYYDFYTGYGALYERIALDIITGDVPDIIDVSRMPYLHWAAAGLFADLIPFIDADPELNRDDLMDIIYRTTDSNGRLYQIFPDFGVQTIVGLSSVLGVDMGWTWDEFKAVIEAHPNADAPIGYINNDSSRNDIFTLGEWINANMGNFVDWENGRSFFDRGDFAELLEFLMKFDKDWGGNLPPRQELKATGRQIMSMKWFGSFGSFGEYNELRDNFGGDIVFKGFPSVSGIGNIGYTNSMMLAITENNTEKQAAWEFIRMILTENWQREQVNRYFIKHSFPTNKNVFEEEAAIAMLDPVDELSILMEWPALTNEEIDKIRIMIDSITLVSGILPATLDNIIKESASDFFNGMKTAEETAEIIQNRASIFISEQRR